MLQAKRGQKLKLETRYGVYSAGLLMGKARLGPNLCETSIPSSWVLCSVRRLLPEPYARGNQRGVLGKRQKPSEYSIWEMTHLSRETPYPMWGLKEWPQMGG